MKNKLIIFILVCVLVTLALAACGHEHVFGKWSTVKEASCSEEGVEERVCQCGEKETRSIEMIAHSFKSETTIAPTCAEVGEKTKTCKYCGFVEKEEIAATEKHTFKDEIIKEATCSQKGQKQQVCSVCGAKGKTSDIAVLPHSFVENIEKNATCEEDGKTINTCSVCGKTETKTIPKLGHSTSWITDSNATCTSNGTKRLVCSRCGKTVQTETLYATGHSWTNATCTQAKRCTKCGATEGYALGHTTSNGTCSRCGQKIQPQISLPSVPLTVSFSKYGDYSQIKITNLSFNPMGTYNGYLSYTATVISMDGSNGRAGFGFKAYNENGVVIFSDLIASSGHSVGETFKDKTFISVDEPISRIEIFDGN